ncbi:hypothetical protein J2Y03_004596 [Neobacillus niacini]|nr:hypothetical protein [Neobacillus niacini]
MDTYLLTEAMCINETRIQSNMVGSYRGQSEVLREKKAQLVVPLVVPFFLPYE